MAADASDKQQSPTTGSLEQLLNGLSGAPVQARKSAPRSNSAAVDDPARGFHRWLILVDAAITDYAVRLQKVKDAVDSEGLARAKESVGKAAEMLGIVLSDTSPLLPLGLSESGRIIISEIDPARIFLREIASAFGRQAGDLEGEEWDKALRDFNVAVSVFGISKSEAMKSIGCIVREKTPPPDPLIVVSIEKLQAVLSVPGKQKLTIDLKSEQAARWLKVLAEHPGEWISAPNLKRHDHELDGARTDLLRKLLPKRIRDLIETSRQLGARLKSLK